MSPRLAGLAALLALASCSARPAPQAELPEGVSLDPTPCWFALADPSWLPPVDCAVLSVPERWDPPGGARVEIPVVALRGGGETDHATLVPGGGGPGGSGGLESDSAERTIQDHAAFVQETGIDLVLIDVRGSGLARPAFQCEALRELTRHWLATEVALEAEVESAAEAARACRAELSAAGIAADAYGTDAVVRDLEALRLALGYARWNLFGTSYAGLLSLAYAQAHPDAVRALVLDSPGVPGGRYLAPAWFAEVLDRLLARCAADPRCRRDFPDPGAALVRLLQRLEAEPLVLRVSHPDTLEPVPVTLTAERLLDVLFTSLYDTRLAHTLPLAITAAERGSLDWLAGLVRGYVWQSLDARFSYALLGAVSCLESFPEADFVRIEEEARDHPWSVAFADAEPVNRASCEAWALPALTMPAVDPSRYTGPALLLTGDLDPVIPLDEVRDLHARLPGSALIELPATGHATDVWHWPCLDPLIGAFLVDPEARLDGDEVEACRRQAAATPFETLRPRETLPVPRATRSD